MTRASDESPAREKDLAPTGAGPLASLSGSGTASDPYLINNWSEFKEVLSYEGTVHGKVNSDIKYAYDWDNSQGPKPIEVVGDVTLDLNGYTVEKYLDDQWRNDTTYLGMQHGTNQMLAVYGKLKIKDTYNGKGTLRTYAYMHTDSDTAENYHVDCASAQGYPITVYEGGDFTMYGGRIAAGRKKKVWCVQGVVIQTGIYDFSDKYFYYCDNDILQPLNFYHSIYVYFRNNGTALTLKEGSSATIYDGSFTGWGFQLSAGTYGYW